MKISLLIFAITLAVGLSAASGNGKHSKIYVPFVRNTITVDGSLNDWDLDGALEMYVMSETKDLLNAKFALMFDEESLYIGGTVTDSSPMMNQHDPHLSPDRGWDADSCQFRFSIDPSMPYPVNENKFQKNLPDNPRIIHATLWYFTGRGEPVLQYLTGMNYKTPVQYPRNGVVPCRDYEAAYKKHADGKGYTFEYRIPWKVFGAAKGPVPGDMTAGTVQFTFGTPDGTRSGGSATWLYDIKRKPGFTFQNADCWGKLIFVENVPRFFLQKGAVSKSTVKSMVLECEVPNDSHISITIFDEKKNAVRQLVSQKKYLAGKHAIRWDGKDDRGNILLPGIYEWKGCYGSRLTGKFILSVHNSGNPPYKLDNGTGGWGGDHGRSRTVAPLKDGMLLAWDAAESGSGIIKVDLNGQKQWGIPRCATYLATDGDRIFYAGDHGFLASSCEIIQLDAKTGMQLPFGDNKAQLTPPGKENEITGLAAGNGILFVAVEKQNKIYRYNICSGELLGAFQIRSPQRMHLLKNNVLLVISEGKLLFLSQGKTVREISSFLEFPKGIASDQKGRIYVANGGNLQNITIFNADGRYAGSIGKKGGRPRVGTYDPDGMLEPEGIAVSADARLWVAESLKYPKRQSVWNIETGRLEQEFFGASNYFAWCWMDPEKPDELYSDNCIWKIDLDSGKWSLKSTIWRNTEKNMILPTHDAYGANLRVLTAQNGMQYAIGLCEYAPMLFKRTGNIFQPFTGILKINRSRKFGSSYPVIYEQKMKYPDGHYLWQDQNNDAVVQENEIIRRVEKEKAFLGLDPELRIYGDNQRIYIPESFQNGAPVYDFHRALQAPAPGYREAGSDDLIDFNENSGFYRRYDGKTGVLKWNYPFVPWPKALGFPLVVSGRVYALTMPLGTAGDFTGAASYFGPYHIMTRDGVYIGTVMRDGRDGKGLGADVTAVEVYHGQLVKPKGMERYFLLAGDQDGRITEIFGLDSMKRLSGGRFIISKEQIQKNQAEQSKVDRESHSARIKRFEILRGGRECLNDGKPLKVVLDDGRAFEVNAAYDRKKLYLRYRVKSDAELTNSITDSNLIFKGGNCIDLQIACNTKADPQRKKPVPGDIRLLFTRKQGVPFAMLYQPKTQKTGNTPVILRSPTGEESFDAIQRFDDFSMTYRKTKDGFSAILEISLTALNLELSSGQELRMDFGYLYGNPEGSVTAIRSYWNNKSFTANVTYDIPHESRIEPDRFGIVYIE